MAEKISVRKTRRLRVLLARLYKLPEPPDPKDSLLEQVVMTVLWEDALPARARVAFVNLTEEFVDWNELRVSVTTEVASVLESCGLPGRKGAVLKRVLSRAIEELFSLDFELLLELPRERLKAWFMRIEGVPHRIAAQILYSIYSYDRVLVDAEIARVIRRLGLVAEDATEQQIEPALNAVIPAKEARLIYNALWLHARDVCKAEDFDCRKCPLRRECQGGKRFIAEMDAAAKAAKEAARKKAKAAAKKEAEAAARREAKAKRKARPKPKAASTAKAKPKPTAKQRPKPRATRATASKSRARSRPKAAPRRARKKPSP